MKLFRLILKNIRRNLGHFSMSAIGIIIGIASLSFFVGLRNGVKRWIHSDDILPLNKIEVIPKKLMGDKDLKREQVLITDGVVATIRRRTEVVAAYPKMKFAFPALGKGGKSLFGENIQIEFIGDGIDPMLVADEKFQQGLKFKDYWAEENPKHLCRTDKECPATRHCIKHLRACSECKTDAECGAGKYCEPKIKMCLPQLKCWPGDPHVRNQDGSYLTDKAGQKVRKRSKHHDCWQASGRFRCDFARKRCTNTCTSGSQCGQYYYCDTRLTKTCYRAVPALISRYILELYNGQIAPGRNWPKITQERANAFTGFTFTTALGHSVMAGEAKDYFVRKVQLVGISRKAIPLGVTVPLGYAKRWNQAFARRNEKKEILASERHKFKTYSSVVVWLRSKSDVTRFVGFLKKIGLAQADSSANTVGKVVDFVGLLLTIVSLVILLISAINISHTYYMIISERRREIGVMRAVGANRWDIRILFIGEASILGLIGGSVGLGIGRGLAALVDFVSARFVAQFMFKPVTYFDFTWWVYAGAVGFGVLFCFLGTILPANQAAKMEPAHALVAK